MKITDLTTAEQEIKKQEIKKVPIELFYCLQSEPNKDGLPFFDDNEGLGYKRCFGSFDEIIRVSKKTYKDLDLVILKRRNYECHFLAKWNDGVLP